ncbi:LSM_domain-containing protein [Hexamita inflata]|uniref:LSM_domain-containing protein n=1 Tax=Hexamita inflata TaxID=28002 RepID=A0ABP1IA98_9EUKA
MKLLSFLQGLKNQRVTIELKSHYVIEGTVSNVDAYMNVFLLNATIFNNGNELQKVDTIAIRGSTIADVQFSDDFNVDLYLSKAYSKEQAKQK